MQEISKRGYSSNQTVVYIVASNNAVFDEKSIIEQRQAVARLSIPTPTTNTDEQSIIPDMILPFAKPYMGIPSEMGIPSTKPDMGILSTKPTFTH